MAFLFFYDYLMLKKVLNKRQNQELIRTYDLNPGEYICSLQINGKNLESKKFVKVQ